MAYLNDIGLGRVTRRVAGNVGDVAGLCHCVQLQWVHLGLSRQHGKVQNFRHLLIYPIVRSFYAPGSNDRGHIVFVLSVYLSACLLSTLTFAITFEPLAVETSYLVCILH